jgi:predicted nuclease with RNAse H fold
MTEWIYLFTSNASFPEPVDEIATLAALDEQGLEVCLMLPDRDAPPMSGASPGERIHLCTRRARGAKLEIHAMATVAGSSFRSSTPNAVVGLYGRHDDRTWLPLEVGTCFGAPLMAEDAGLDIDEETFARGQAYVKRVDRRHSSAPRPMSSSPTPSPSSVRRAVPEQVPTRFAPGAFLGIDLTAGSWESGMDLGDKPFPCARLDVGDGGRLRWTGAESFTSLTCLLAHQWLRDASVIAIDGPVRLCGARVNDARTGFVYDAPRVRPAERALSRMGIKLFWTTRPTLEHFDGAARWIARSLILFQDLAKCTAITAPAIEIHPHGVFVVLNQTLHGDDDLPKKTKQEGRARRLEILRRYVADLADDALPDHDTVDACGAALMAALHGARASVGIGDDAEGGRIWIPGDSP